MHRKACSPWGKWGVSWCFGVRVGLAPEGLVFGEKGMTWGFSGVGCPGSVRCWVVPSVVVGETLRSE